MTIKAKNVTITIDKDLMDKFSLLRELGIKVNLSKICTIAVTEYIKDTLCPIKDKLE